MIRLLCLSGFLLLAWPALAAEDGSSALVEGNKAYAEGQYERAAKAYSRAINQGLNNGHVYYNLGNALYRLNLFGAAIAKYRRALRQLPGDPDVLANLALAREKAVDKIEEALGGPRALFERLLFFRTRLTAYSTKALFLGTYCAFWAFFACAPLFSPAFKRWGGALLFVAVLYTGVLVFCTVEGRSGRPVFSFGARVRPAVVTAAEAPVHSGNSENFQVVFLLHDGAEVLTGDQRDNWVEIFLPEGRHGWVKKQQMEIL